LVVELALSSPPEDQNPHFAHLPDQEKACAHSELGTGAGAAAPALLATSICVGGAEILTVIYPAFSDYGVAWIRPQMLIRPRDAVWTSSSHLFVNLCLEMSRPQFVPIVRDVACGPHGGRL